MPNHDISGEIIIRQPGESDDSLIKRRAAFVEVVTNTRAETATRIFLKGIDPTYYADEGIDGMVDLPPRNDMASDTDLPTPEL